MLLLMPSQVKICLHSESAHVIMRFREISLLPVRRGPIGPQGPDHKEVRSSMNKYELAVVVSAKSEEEERNATVNKCKSYVERYGGTILDVEDGGKKKLAYEIQDMKEAYYYFIHFESEGSTPIEVEKHVRLREDVIRYLCVRQDEE